MEQHAGDAPTIDATEASLFDAEWYTLLTQESENP